jgi:hypothetical protein
MKTPGKKKRVRQKKGLGGAGRRGHFGDGLEAWNRMIARGARVPRRSEYLVSLSVSEGPGYREGGVGEDGGRGLGVRKNVEKSTGSVRHHSP